MKTSKFQAHKLHPYPILLLLLAAFLGNCNKDQENILEAITGPDTIAGIGDTVWLDASASKGENYTISWTFHNQPGDDSIAWSDSVTAFFIPSENGAYQVKLEIRSADLFSSNFQNVLVDGPVRLQNITQRTRLSKIAVGDGADYIVTHSLTVSAELIIDIGVIIEFTENASMHVLDEGTIYAGNASFVAADSTWKGIVVESTGNVFTGCLIENGGNESLTADPDQKAGIVLKRGATLAFSGNTLKQSAGYGIVVIEGGEFYEDTENQVFPFRNNRFVRNAGGPMLIPVTVLSELAGQYFEEETEGTFLEIYESVYPANAARNPWFSEQGMPYLITGVLQINRELTISNGVEMYFEADAGLKINGKLTISGTETDPVIMDGVSDGTAYWKGIYTLNGQVDIAWLNLLDAGSSVFPGLSEKSALRVEHLLSMQNSTISGSGGIGLFLPGTAHVQYSENFTGNSFVNNAASAIRIRLDDVSKVVDGNSIKSATGVPAVEVHMGLDDPPGTWKNLDAEYDYRILEPVKVKATKELSIEAGTVIRMSTGSTLTISGALTALGSAVSGISILGHEENKGYWDGIFLNGTQSVRLDFVTIRHGGGGFQDKGNLIVQAEATDVSITNSTITQSKGYGVLIKSGAQHFGINDPASANTLEGEQGGFHDENN